MKVNHFFSNGKLIHIVGENKMAKRIGLRLIKTEDIQEKSETPFVDVVEGSIDTDNMIIKNACLFGTRESANNRVYQTKAIDSIMALSEGVKCYINHPTKSEIKERDGVRDLRDWAGVYRSPRREGEKVFADLYCREEYFDLLKDIAELQPANVGNSINARVKVFMDDKGMESVVDVDSLRSVDLVSNAATTSSLFESAINENKENFDWYIPEVLERTIKDRFEVLLAKEGVIQDKLKNDEIRRGISDVTYTAHGLIEDVVYNKELGIPDKKKKVIAIFDDLEKEIKKKMEEIKESIKGEKRMDITLDVLKAENKDLVEAIIEEYKQSENVKKTEEKIVALEAEIESLKGSIEEKDKEVEEASKKIEELEKERDDLAKKLDDVRVAEAKSEKKALALKLIKESGLLDEDVSDILMENLMRVVERKEAVEGEDEPKIITVEEQMKAQIKDRKELIDKNSGKVVNSGDEFVVKDDTKESKIEDVDKEVDKFVSEIK